MKFGLSFILFSALATFTASSSPAHPSAGGHSDGNMIIKQLHDEWKAKYGIRYLTEEDEAKRFDIFAQNLEYISEHNERFHRGEVSFDMALNGHSDLSYEEWEASRLAYTPSPIAIDADDLFFGLHHTGASNVKLLRGTEGDDVPDSIDWTKRGAVTAVKDQGQVRVLCLSLSITYVNVHYLFSLYQCGSCWSFSSTGAMEGAHFIATGNLVSLSEEQLINCVKGGEFDCDTGGEMVEAFKYVIKNGGIVAEATDPYRLKDHQKCKYRPDATTYVATFSGYKLVPSNDEDSLKSAVARQPVAVGMDASHRSFQFYHSGVYDEEECCTDCTSEDLDHGVLAVGYGTTDDNVDYWIIKNSWNQGWGDAGYIKIKRNDKGRCGIPTSASYPVV